MRTSLDGVVVVKLFQTVGQRLPRRAVIGPTTPRPAIPVMQDLRERDLAFAGGGKQRPGNVLALFRCRADTEAPAEP